jgi:putative ABC transport system permease protein
VSQSMLLATLRNLARNRIYTIVGILGLAIGLCAALLTGLSVSQQLSFEHFIPGYERTYQVISGLAPLGRSPVYFSASPGFQAALMQRSYPQIESIARLTDSEVTLKQDQIEATETIYWADPSVFKVLPLPVAIGPLNDSLQRPDSIVLTQRLAHKYFGDRNPVGRTLLLNGSDPKIVTAVVRDLPLHQTNLDAGAFLSGTDPRSRLADCDRHDVENAKRGAFGLCGLTYFRLRPRTHIERLRERATEVIDSFPSGPFSQTSQTKVLTDFIRIDRVNLFEGLRPGARSAMAEAVAIAGLILFAGCIVFVNLATARAARRAREVGVRKACGADRWALVAQFLGESLLTVMLAAILAMSMTELLLPRLNAFLDVHVEFDYWRQPALLGWIALGVLLVGLLAGAYPALVLSSFRPKDALKGSVSFLGGQWGRQILVVSQCAILISLIVGAIVISQQRHFATHEALRVNTDEVLVIHSPCKPSLVDALRALPGVRQVACSTDSFLTREAFCGNCQLRSGVPLTVDTTDADFGAFGLYGIAPLAGSLDARDADGSSHEGRSHTVINEALSRALGFASPAAAIGQSLEIKEGEGHWLGPTAQSEIVAVVPDFAVEAVVQRVRPTVYWPIVHASGLSAFFVINLKLAGQQIPETLAAIDDLWNRVGQDANATRASPIQRFFLRDYIENLYRDVLRQAQTFGIFALVAVALASLGLLGLASAIADRRTKEVGIRKAMGAGNADILKMLLRQFSLPILWASLIAWPVSAILLRRWLETFARHVSLQPWVFVVASLLALVISLATVSVQAWRVAAAKPVAALHYE